MLILSTSIGMPTTSARFQPFIYACKLTIRLSFYKLSCAYYI